MRAIIASDLPHAAVRLAVRIALHLHVDTGRCYPTHATLARETGIGERSIYRLVAFLDQAGWIAVQGTRGRNANNYILLDPANPDTPSAGLNDTEPCQRNVRVGSVEPCQVNAPTLPNSGSNPATQAGRQKGENRKRKQERESISPDFDFGGSKGEDTRATKAEVGESFDQFWAVYPKRVEKDAARKAFGKALERGARAEAMIKGAQAYAVQREGEDPKYTKHPAKWLNTGCYDDETPGLVIDQEGNPVAVEEQQQPKRRGEMTWEEAGEIAITKMGGGNGQFH
jgi:hypothetical protein